MIILVSDQTEMFWMREVLLMPEFASPEGNCSWTLILFEIEVSFFFWPSLLDQD